MEKVSYVESEDTLVVETVYDPTPTIELAAAYRQEAPVVVGSKGQSLALAAVIDLDHIVALRNKGYDLLSPDPDERRRALCYIQSEESKWLTTDKKMFALHRPKWE